MGIDGIGKPGATAPGEIGSSAGSGRVSTGETFQVGPKSSVSAADPSEALGRLQRGEISIDDYLEDRVEHAISHLTQKLSPSEQDFVRETLREQLKSDPVLIELTRRATVT